MRSVLHYYADSFIDVVAVWMLLLWNAIAKYLRPCRSYHDDRRRDNTVGNLFPVVALIHVDARGKGKASFWFDGRDPFS
jgi:hypothetical protein